MAAKLAAARMTEARKKTANRKEEEKSNGLAYIYIPTAKSKR
jgi:hypothetical protein